VSADDIREVVARARRRDPDAWDALYRRVHPTLHAYARRRVSSPHAADDAVSETMMRALERIETFVWRGNGFDAWLHGILRNVLYENGRVYARAAVGHHVREVGTDEHEPLGRVLAREEAASVRQAFEQLSGGERRVLELRVLDRRSAEDTGEVLGKRAGAVRMAQARALDRLRALLVSGGRARPDGTRDRATAAR
jgi:RNA polymerase sigma-70 factor (ECF subfamily)